MKWLYIIFLATPCFGQSNYIVEDLQKEGQVQAYKMNYDKKFSITGGTVTGKSFFSTMTVISQNVDTLTNTNAVITNADINNALISISTVSSTVITNIVNGTNFTSSVSTVTFNGWIGIGWERITNTVTSSTSTATCSAGKKIIGGGCSHATTAFSQGYPGTDTSFTCALSDTLSLTAYAICARIK